MIEKKERELRAVELFLEKSGLLPAGSAMPSEKPDVLVYDGKSHAARIVRLAEERDRQSSGLPCLVTVHFRLEHIRRHDASDVADRLLARKSTAVLPPGVVVTRGVGGTDEEEIHPFVDAMTLLHMADLEASSWGKAVSGWLGWVTPELVQERLDQKEVRIGGYRQDLAEKWLLLVCDASAPSAMLKLPSDLSQWLFHSSFDRVFVMDCTASAWCELRLCAQP